MRENVRNVSRGRAGRERWEFALDTRQIAAVAVGVLVIVGSSFVLGMNTGKGLARRSAAAPTATSSLDAFDTAHENLPTPPEPKSWEYEKLGGTSRGSESPAHAASAPAGAAASSAQARVPPPARPLPRASDEVASQAPAAVAAAPSSATAQPAPAAPPAPAAGASAAPQPATVATAAAPAKSPAPVPSSAPAAKPKPSAPAPSAMERAIAAVGGAPVKTSTTSVASATATGAGAFVIQVGASPNRAEADRIAKKFASRGARVLAADVDGKRWYRVRLASTTYDSRSDAERALSRLARETGVRGFVTAAR